MAKKPVEEKQEETEITNNVLFHVLKDMAVELSNLKTDLKSMKMLLQQYAQVRR